MKDLPQKGFLHKSGELIPIPFDRKVDLLPEDHAVFAAKNPHLFGSSEKEMESVVGPKQFKKLKAGETSWSQPLHNFLNDKGYYRLYSKRERSSDGGYNHEVMVSTENQSAHPEDFIEPVKKLKEHASKLGKEDFFAISLSGFKDRDKRNEFLQSRGLKQINSDAVILSSMNHLNKFIGESGGKVSRDPVPTPKPPSEMEIRSALGQKPASMSTAEWNFYTRSESTETMNFTVLLEKIKENKLLKRVAMKNYSSPQGILSRETKEIDPKTREDLSKLDAGKKMRVAAQARKTWEREQKQRDIKKKEQEKITNLMLGPNEENLGRYDLIMKLASQKSRASRQENKKYGYPLKTGSYGAETMERIASTFARRSGKTLPPTGSAHY
jgi:hypothetical protein